MSRSSNVARRLASPPRPCSIPSPRICLPCFLTLRHASAATAPSPTPEPTPISQTPAERAPTPSVTRPRAHRIRTSVLLSRPPILTRDLHPFEKAYFLYQRRLNERLALPFSRYFYYSKGTPGDVAWKRAMRERQTPARDIGKYHAYGKEGWNDELLVNDKTSEPDEQVAALIQDAEGFLRKEEGDEEVAVEVEGEGLGGLRSKKEEVIQRPVERVGEADRRGDERSLSRKMDRTLYLLVKEEGEKEGWAFPTSWLGAKESLHTAAERIIVQAGGVNMNTWVVGNWPVGHQILNYPQPKKDAEKDIETLGEKAFFMKARIMAGQANLQDNQLGLTDFKWLAKDEIQRVLDPRDWNGVKNTLAER